MNKRPYRAAQAIVCGLFALDLGAIIWLDTILVKDRPSKPVGKYLIEHPSHGTSTFISTGDHQLYILVWVALFVLLGVSKLLYHLYRPDWRSVSRERSI